MRSYADKCGNDGGEELAVAVRVGGDAEVGVVGAEGAVNDEEGEEAGPRGEKREEFAGREGVVVVGGGTGW